MIKGGRGRFVFLSRASFSYSFLYKLELNMHKLLPVNCSHTWDLRTLWVLASTLNMTSFPLALSLPLNAIT